MSAKEGLEPAIKKEAFQITKNFIAPSVSDGLWKAAASRLDTKLVGSPYGRLAEKAFKKTMSSIMINGAEALVK